MKKLVIVTANTQSQVVSASQTSALCPLLIALLALIHCMVQLILCLQLESLGWQRARNLYYSVSSTHRTMLGAQNKLNKSTSEAVFEPRSIASASSIVGVCKNVGQQLFSN